MKLVVKVFSRVFSYESCSKQFARMNEFNRHFRAIHAQSSNLSCTLCSKQTRQGNLPRHMKTHTHDSSTETQGKFICKIGCLGFMLSSEFGEHQREYFQSGKICFSIFVRKKCTYFVNKRECGRAPTIDQQTNIVQIVRGLFNCSVYKQHTSAL